MVGVTDLSTTKDLAQQLNRLGYEDCGGSDDRRYFRKRGEVPHYKVQVIEYASPTWNANVLFRDFLSFRPGRGEALQRHKTSCC